MSVTINFMNNNFEFKMVIKQLWQFLAMFSCRTVALLKKTELANFRITVANKSELEVCLYFFPIDKHV